MNRPNKPHARRFVAASSVDHDGSAPYPVKEEDRRITTEAILDSISDGVLTVDTTLTITSFNRAAEAITGIERGNAIGRPCAAVFRSSLCGEECPMRKTLATRIPLFNLEAFLTSHDGRRIPVTLSTTLLRNSKNDIIGGTETLHDLSQRAKPPGPESAPIAACQLTTRNPIMGRLLRALPGMAATHTPILIEGEQGTGKASLARAIHDRSPWRDKPFIASRRMAACPVASGKSGADWPTPLPASATLFLDEISRLDGIGQKRLLHLLTTGSAGVPAGEGIRIIAATSGNLVRLVASGAFPLELLQHLNGLILHLPPLRERKEDIALLTDHFIRAINLTQHKEVLGVSPDVLALLTAYHFPGNISELENIIRRALDFCCQGYLLPAHLPREFQGRQGELRGSFAMGMAVQATETQTIIAALQRNKFNRKAAARELGIHKSTFFRKIKQLGIILPEMDGRFRLPGTEENRA